MRMISPQDIALRGWAPADVSISLGRWGYKVEIDGLSFLELQELIAAVKLSRGVA